MPSHLPSVLGRDSRSSHRRNLPVHTKVRSRLVRTMVHNRCRNLPAHKERRRNLDTDRTCRSNHRSQRVRTIDQIDNIPS